MKVLRFTNARAVFLLAAALSVVSLSSARAAAVEIAGHLKDPQGQPVRDAVISLINPDGVSVVDSTSGSNGVFKFRVDVPGAYTIRVKASGFPDLAEPLIVRAAGVPDLTLAFTAVASQRTAVTVTADVGNLDIQYPDPATKVYVRDQILDANPGRPGAPVSIPGYPIESASGGIKAPQYFAPGVAGDHGEPISTFFQVGSYLVPNNLSANAHGNGYSDPNAMIPQIIESVQVDGGAFNVREGNHSVNVAEIYGFRQRLEPYVTVTGDYRDIDLTAGWSSENPDVKEFFAVEAAYGNGFLQRLEHRQQFKFNGFRIFNVGSHQLTVFGIGYYGVSYVPGLVPIDVPNLQDTIDKRQRDQTHSAEIALNDVWKLTPSSELQSSAFFRSYNLSLYSNFGDGLIRQSEYRTVTGGNESYVKKFSDAFSLMAGVDYLRDAPRRLDLDHYDNATDTSFYGAFQKVTANDVTLNFITPYIAVDGKPAPWLRYNLGWRRDQLDTDNQDVLRPYNSFQRWTGINSPKATLSLIAPQKWWLPSAAFSFGQTFFSNDPRIGNGSMEGSTVSRAHSLQLVLSKSVAGTDLRVTLGRITQEQSLAKIDADTGLQFDEGPSRNYFITMAARHYFGWGSLQGSVSKADARDLSDGLPVPEAPRFILDFLGTVNRLPFHLHARAEYEQVGAKPLGDGFRSVPVKELRGALARPFLNGRLDAGINFLIASGYTGQTTEVLSLPAAAEASELGLAEQVAGVYLPSYISASFTYHFRPRMP